jgi:hypothetical protein
MDLRDPAENPEMLSWWRLPTIFQGADERFPWFAQTEAILSVNIVGMELNHLPTDVIHVSGEGGGVV